MFKLNFIEDVPMVRPVLFRRKPNNAHKHAQMKSSYLGHNHRYFRLLRARGMLALLAYRFAQPYHHFLCLIVVQKMMALFPCRRIREATKLL
jgi:hypothetical protein